MSEEKKRPPVIFLDMDGVLCTTRAHVAYRGNLLMRHLDPVSVKLVESLCIKAEAKLVLSSTWRAHFDLSAMNTILVNGGFSDVPWHSNWRTPRRPNMAYIGRGEEIGMWLDEHKPNNYLILDDDTDMLEEQRSHFVQTSTFDGLLWDHYEAACRILGVKS